MAIISLTWKDFNLNEDGFNIYRSETPMDVNNMPAPIATVGPNVGSYDDVDIIDNRSTYYYRIGSLRSGEEKISEEHVFWSFDSPVIYTVTDDNLFKISPTGDILMQSNIGVAAISVVIDSEDNIYVGRTDDRLTKFSPKGTHIWEIPANFPQQMTIDNKDGIYINSYRNVVQKFDIDGNMVWETTQPNTSYGSSVGVSISGDVYASSRDYVNVYDSETGVETYSWRTNQSDTYFTIPDNNGNFFYGSSSYDTVYKINSSDNSVLWSFGTPNQPVHASLDMSGSLLVGDRSGNIYKLNSTDGRVIWHNNDYAGWIQDLSIDVSGNIYVSIGTKVIALDPNGLQLWSIDLGDDTKRLFINPGDYYINNSISL